MRNGLAAASLVLAAAAGCAAPVAWAPARFDALTPGAPLAIDATLIRPAGPGPFPAVVQLHGCAGVESQSYRWARWLATHGYVALVVDSFRPRAVRGECRSAPDDPPITARLDDAMGALRYLQAQPFVRADRVGVIGWSQGGVYALAAVNGPSLERARKRGVDLPRTGFAAAVAVYPGGCDSLKDEQVVRPLLLLMGDADDWTPADACLEMASAMTARGAEVSLVVYPRALHYFDVEGLAEQVLPDVENHLKPGGLGATVGYDPAAADDARRRVVTFLDRHLRAPER